jgi:uncharacterized protein YaiL (DUF2058 family)
MSLKDELLKANLINKKQLKQLEHQERVEHKKIGREGAQEKKQQQQQAVEEQQKAKRQRDQQQAKVDNEERAVKEKQARVEDIVRQGRIQQGVFGNRKFYFVSRSRKIYFLSIQDAFSEKLEHGDAAIVEIKQPSGYLDFVVVNQQAASQLMTLQPDIVCFYQQQ